MQVDFTYAPGAGPKRVPPGWQQNYEEYLELWARFLALREQVRGRRSVAHILASIADLEAQYPAYLAAKASNVAQDIQAELEKLPLLAGMERELAIVRYAWAELEDVIQKLSECAHVKAHLEFPQGSPATPASHYRNVLYGTIK